MTHFNPAQTDSVSFAGPTKDGKLTRAQIETVPTVFTSNATIKKVGGQTTVFAAGVAGIAKILATGESLEEISFLPWARL